MKSIPSYGPRLVGRDRLVLVVNVDAKHRVAGVILAGGASRRMGGAHKGLLGIAGKPMIEHVAERLAPQVLELAISVYGEGAAFSRFGRPLIADAASEQHGPLVRTLAGRPQRRFVGLSGIR